MSGLSQLFTWFWRLVRYVVDEVSVVLGSSATSLHFSACKDINDWTPEMENLMRIRYLHFWRDFVSFRVNLDGVSLGCAWSHYGLTMAHIVVGYSWLLLMSSFEATKGRINTDNQKISSEISGTVIYLNTFNHFINASLETHPDYALQRAAGLDINVQLPAML